MMYYELFKIIAGKLLDGDTGEEEKAVYRLALDKLGECLKTNQEEN